MCKNIILCITSLLFVACGGGSTSNNKARVELGPISGATVKINSLEGNQLGSYITDSNGYYDPDKTKLKDEINKINPEMKYVRIISIGGIDIDPNDDEVIVESEKKEVNGSVSGIIPVSKLLDEKEFRINAFTSVVERSLKNTLDINESIINKVIQENDVDDINNDGDINIDDIIYYKMSEHESNAEKTLRESWIPVLTSGDQEEEASLIQDYKSRFNFISPIFKNNNITFPSLTGGYYIQYSIQKDYSAPSFNTYFNGEELSLNNFEVMYYQECSILTECSKIQKIYFDGENYFVDYLKMQDGYIFKNEVISDFKNNENQLIDEITEIEEEIQEIKNTDLLL